MEEDHIVSWKACYRLEAEKQRVVKNEEAAAEQEEVEKRRVAKNEQVAAEQEKVARDFEAAAKQEEVDQYFKVMRENPPAVWQLE